LSTPSTVRWRSGHELAPETKLSLCP